jgi:hypothetical protein
MEDDEVSMTTTLINPAAYLNIRSDPLPAFQWETLSVMKARGTGLLREEDSFAGCRKPWTSIYNVTLKQRTPVLTEFASACT